MEGTLEKVEGVLETENTNWKEATTIVQDELG